MSLPLTDTIAAIATARGRAALAIVRLSGPDALPVVDRCFPSKDLSSVPSHTVHVGYLEGIGGVGLDQVVVTVFRAPASATGEDVVEITCHGGDVAPQLVLQALLDAGARMARPGEFTERAFLHGKLDLTQAEAVAELIHAHSTLAHRVALRHLQGRYSEVLSVLRGELLHLCALIELELDFSEEDVAFADHEALRSLLVRADALLDELLGSYQLGQLVRDGVRVVIGGRPNAGKSTLLNALVGRDCAIVSDVPGTTRDVIEAEAEIGGLLFRFTDTAGLRTTSDAIESEGVRRAEQAAQTAELLVYLFDASLGLDEAEQEWLQMIARAHPSLPVILVANKADLPLSLPNRGGGEDVLYLSALTALSDPPLLTPLRDRLLYLVGGDLADSEAAPIVMSQRHRQHLSNARAALLRALVSLEARRSGDVIALDLRRALHELGSVTGEVTNEEVLGAIFSSFCIGK